MGASGLASVAVPWLIGTLIALWVLPPRSAWIIIVVAAVPAASLACIQHRLWPLWLIAGVSWTTLHIDARIDERLPQEHAGRDFSVSGWIDGFPRGTSSQAAFSFKLTESSTDVALPSRLRLNWYDPPLELHAGMPLDLTVRLKPPRGLDNPGGFDYERWLFIEGYGATGYVRSGTVAAQADGSIERGLLERRAAIAARIREAVAAPDARALLTALAIGERFEFTDEHWATLRRTGTSHLVAISGLHVGIVSTLLFVLCRRLWLRTPAFAASYDLEVSALVSFLGAVGYAALAGFSVPTQRALIMLAVALIALGTRRPTTMVAGLSAAVLFVLLWDPLAPLSPSFWLSFAAVALLWQLGSLRARGDGGGSPAARLLSNAARLQWGMALGLIPIVAWSFGELSIVSPLVNFLAIPLFSFVLVPLTLLATVMLCFEPVGSVLFGAAAAVSGWIYSLLAALAHQSWAAVQMPSVDVWSMVLLGAGVGIALPSHALPGRYLGWIAVLAPFAQTPERPGAGEIRATVLDVGHGLAVLVQTRAHAMLYDTGARYRSGFDSGSEIVVPALHRLGVTKLDTVIVSHADNDHAGGLGAVLRTFPDAEIIVGPDLDHPRAARCRRGHQWEWDGARFELAHPPADFPALGNDSSCVLRVSAAGHALLLTGDLERRGERALLASGADLRADVVIVPHHGSATSSSAALTAATRPLYAVVSAAFSNQWGFPKAEVIGRWTQVGAEIIVTGDAGAISLSFSDSGGVELYSRRARSARPWRAEAR